MESTPSPDTEPTGLKPEQLSDLWRRHLERVLRRAERQRKRGRATRPAAPKPERSAEWTPRATTNRRREVKRRKRERRTESE